MLLSIFQTFNWLETADDAERFDIGQNLGLALKVGEINGRVMELLDLGHRERFGAPTPTEVSTRPVPGKVCY